MLSRLRPLGVEGGGIPNMDVIKLYPTPTKDLSITVDLLDLSRKDDLDITILNLEGQNFGEPINIVISKNNAMKKVFIELPSLSTGFYILSIKNGESIIYKPFIVE